MEVPVLVLLFNRPETTSQVLAAIESWKIKSLYLAADGPRKDQPDDVRLCAEARATALRLAGNRPTKTLFRDSNLGAGRAVSTAIDWFFYSEEYGIILEDDCVPNSSFLPFCEELLERYQHSPEVMMISGNNFLFDLEMAPDTYMFTKHAHIWGWATWRRAWTHNDFYLRQWNSLRESKFLQSKCGGYPDASKYWGRVFNSQIQQDFPTWDYQWQFSIWARDGVTITPARNLVTNIGFGKGASNTHSQPPWLRKLRNDPLLFPLQHPLHTVPDRPAQRWTDLHVFRTKNVVYRVGRFIAPISRKLGIEHLLRRVFSRTQLLIHAR
jgi:hypothetical protein